VRHRALLILLLAVLAVRLASLGVIYAGHPERVVTADGAVYDSGARVWLATGSFIKNADNPQSYQTLRTPGYSAYLALCYKLLGPGHLPALVLQVVISLLPLALAYLIAARLWDQPTGLLAAGLLALDPTSLVFSHLLQTETIFAALLMLAVWLGLRLGQEKPLAARWALAFALALALATLVRPISYFLFWPLLAWMLLSAWREGATRRALALATLAALLPWALLIGGWQWRNYQAAGSAHFSHLQPLLLLDYQAAYLLAGQEGVDPEQVRARLRAQAEAGVPPGSPPAARFQAYEKLALTIIAQHPVAFAGQVAAGLAKVLLNPVDATLYDFYGGNSSRSGSIGDLRKLSPRAYLSKWLTPANLPYLLVNTLALLYLLALYAGALAGAWPAFARERGQLFAHVLLWLALLYLLATPAGPGGGARFRIPALPILCLYAAHGLRLWLVKEKTVAPTSS
jgi:4-amino-4-deoxy-L-arabinose transferase-like glycosyltransferase